MLRLDHLTVIAPTLAEGVDHVRACLDLDIPYGGVHPEMGTHNHVLRLGDEAYMEIIAIDPKAPAPTGPRWFGFGDPAAVRRDWDAGRRLRTWVAATDSLDAVLADYSALFGSQTRISRGGKYSQFSLLPDGALPMDGILPSIIDRGGRPPPTPRMDDHGAVLRAFVLDHPNPSEVDALYERIGIANAPVVREGPAMRYVAKIDTPTGGKTLT
ncbi:MAG: VOC family protein [Pseudomonadota bacterium]